MRLKNLKLIFATLLLLLIPFIFSGCDEKKVPGIVFNSEPITKDNLLHATRSLEAGKRVYYLFYSPKKIKAEFIRVQLVKTGDNIAKGGYKIVWSKDCRLMQQNMFYYYDNFTLYQAGRYVMQVFDVNNLSVPLAWNYFFIHE